MMTGKQLGYMIGASDVNELEDLSRVLIKEELPSDEKMSDFLQQIKNPYCFLCGDVPVRISFAQRGPTLVQALENYFTHIKRG